MVELVRKTPTTLRKFIDRANDFVNAENTFTGPNHTKKVEDGAIGGSNKDEHLGKRLRKGSKNQKTRMK